MPRAAGVKKTAMSESLQHWLARLEAQHPADVIALGLERVREVAARMGLGRPARHVITVGGTNGKGSTVAFIEAIARAMGRRVGCYTSPHLLRYNERVRVDAVEASDAELVAAFEAVEAARGQVALTYFEAGTLAALWRFAQADLDVAVLEVGLGGRLDAVNSVDADCAVITTVDLDHQDLLGADTEAIGAEKAGIARPGRPLVLGDEDPPASVLRHAYAIGAPSWRFGSDFFAEPLEPGQWQWRDAGARFRLPLPALTAPVQQRNAACAIAALRALGYPLTEAAIATGLTATQLAARLQCVRHQGREIYLDVGHNPQAATALAEALQRLPARPVWAVYAALADKHSAGVVAALRAQVGHWVLAGSLAAGRRGQSATALAGQLGLPEAAYTVQADVPQALALARQQAPADARILVFGSFHAAQAAWQVLAAEGAI